MFANLPFSYKTFTENSKTERVKTGTFTPRKLKDDITRYMNAKFLRNPRSERKPFPVTFPTDPNCLKDFNRQLFPPIKEAPKRPMKPSSKHFTALIPWFQYMKEKYLDSVHSSEEIKRNIISYAVDQLIEDIKRDSRETSEVLKLVIESYSDLWNSTLKKEQLYHNHEISELLCEIDSKRKRLEAFSTSGEIQYDKHHPVHNVLNCISKANIKIQELNTTPNKKEIFKALNALYSRTPGTKGKEFSEIVYEDFVNASQVRYSEMRFRAFVVGCLKYPSVKRISNFLRLMKVGHLCSMTNFSKFSCDFYLKCNSVAFKSKMDAEIIEKWLELARNFLVPEKYDSYLKNADSVIDKEAFLTSLVDSYENTQKEILANATSIHTALTHKTERNYFEIQEVHAILNHISVHKLGKYHFQDLVVDLNDFVEFCIHKGALTSYDIDQFLDKFTEIDIQQTRKTMKFAINSQIEINDTLTAISESTRIVSPKYSMLCWLIFNPNSVNKQ